jgi:hypothetical protein
LTDVPSDDASGDERVAFPGADRPAFLRRTLRLEPGDCRPYRAAEWWDCMVVIESGEVELEATSGARHTFRGGDVLWLAGLPLCCIRNIGGDAAIITTVRRRGRAGDTQPRVE